jgi:hypothetical protein
MAPPLRALSARAGRIARDEGFAALLRHTVSYAQFVVSRVVRYNHSYLYTHFLIERDEKDYLPRLESCDVRVIHSNSEADSVAAEGFEDLRKVLVYSPRALDRGAIAFCVYVDRSLAHVGWVALTPAAKQAVDRLPYKVDFADGEACTGGTYTIDRFRGRNLMAYGYYLRLEYLRKLGCTVSRNAVVVNNTASQKSHAKFSPEIWATGRFIQVLRWHRWTEKPLPGGPVRGLPPATGR